jgi:hypothetical protein
MIADRATGRVAVVKSPMFTDLSDDQYVIPTEAKHRSTGRDLFAKFAHDMGIPGFKSGRDRKKPLSEGAKAKARKEARGHVPKKTNYQSDDIAELPGVERAKVREADQEREISIYESTIKEPESFITPIGKDAAGNPIYAVNQGAVNQYAGQLNQLAAMYDTLIQRIKDVQTAVDKALKAVQSVINRATANIKVLNRRADAETGTINSKKTSPHNRQRARERLKVYRDAINDEEESRKNAETDKKSLGDERHDTGFRIREAQIQADQARADAAGIQGKADADVASSNPQASQPGAVDPFDAGNLSVSKGEAELALAQIGQGLNGAPPRSIQDITKDIISSQQGIIGTATAMLNDADPSNDAAAYSAISSAAGGIQSAQGNIPNIANETSLLSDARGSLLGSFGSNALTTGALSGYPTPGTVGVSPTGGFPAGGQGNIINVTNNYKTQPVDPHTWSRSLLFELQAAT